MSLEVCEALLGEKMTALKMGAEVTEVDLKTMVFVLQYMLTRLSVSLTSKNEYSNILLGVKVHVLVQIIIIIIFLIKKKIYYYFCSFFFYFCP